MAKHKSTQQHSANVDAEMNAAIPTVEEAAKLPDTEQPERGSSGEPFKPVQLVSSNGTANKLVETKAQKFERLLARRMPRLLKAIDAVKNLANQNQYQRQEGDAEQIVADIREAFESLRRAYAGEKAVASSWALKRKQ